MSNLIEKPDIFRRIFEFYCVYFRDLELSLDHEGSFHFLLISQQICRHWY